MQLPISYQWLTHIEQPRIIQEGLALLGVAERHGPEHNPEIMQWAAECGLSRSYTADEIPWCGLYAAVVVKRASWEPVRDPLWARNWSGFGLGSPKPGLGDVLVFSRGSGGHVGFYIAEDADAYHVLGGNQGDKVSIVRILRTRLLHARRPQWRVAQPASVKPYRVAMGGGKLSENEA